MSKIPENRSGFTLIELLVVVAIIALLLSVLIPALKKAKQIAAAAVCLANTSQLGKAWYLYAEDNHAKIVDGDTSDNLTQPGYTTYGTETVWNWVGRPMGPNGENVNKTLDDKIRGFEAGALWSYIEAPDAYHCPVDTRYVNPAICPRNDCSNYDPDWFGGYRSYSLGKPLSKRPAGNNDVTGEVSVEVSKLSQFKSPGNKIVFLEEMDGYGWNHRTWNMNLRVPNWVDPFAVWHNESSTFVFADGHSDRHKWVSKSTLEMAKAQRKGDPAIDNGQPSEDYIWFKRAYIPGPNPLGL